MDLVQVGKFIAALRREHGFTQEQLGEKLGVTNKTVSRWETGSYLPPADALLRMSEMFGLSINELLSGKRLTDAEYKAAAEENLTRAVRSGGFSIKERIDFYKKKWIKEHAVFMLFLGLCVFGIFVFGLLTARPLPLSIAPVLLVLAHVWRYNAMMSYVEAHVYG